MNERDSFLVDDLSTGSKRLQRTVGFDLPGGTYAAVVLWALG